MQTFIFACIHNAGRSQMAAAFFNSLANPHKARAISAGTEPSARLHPEVLEVMLEIGLDLSTSKPQLLTERLARDASWLVTMGCGEKCPYVPGLLRNDWPIRDPKGLPLEDVREVRNEVKRRVAELIDQEQLRPTSNRDMRLR